MTVRFFWAPCVRFLWVGFLLFVFCQPAEGLQEKQEDSKFKQMAEALRSEIKLEIEKQTGKIELKIPQSREDAQALYSSLNSILGYGGGGGGSQTSWHYTSGNPDYTEASFRIQHFQDGAGRNDSIRCLENVPPYRRVEIDKWNDGRITILFIDPTSDVLGRLAQGKEKVQLWLKKQNRCLAVSASSFKELVGGSGKVVSEFGELLTECGIANRYGAFYPVLLEEVGKSILPPQETSPAFLRVLEDLASKKFKVREQASESVRKRFVELEPRYLKICE